MTSIRAVALLVGLGLSAACNGSSAYAADEPLPGARPPESNDQTRALQSQTPLRNSDNKPIDSRTGINSDPNNPNGVARPSTDVKGN
jgi:hypothetical protein